MSDLESTNVMLHKLTGYLVEQRGLLPALAHVRAIHSPDEDRRNEADPRGFCHVVEDEWNIYCAERLEWMPTSIMLGLLLHEIGHIYIPAMDGPESEVLVDEWVLKTVPEAMYYYLPEISYFSRAHKGVVYAKNIQSVSFAFVNKIDRR